MRSSLLRPLRMQQLPHVHMYVHTHLLSFPEKYSTSY